MMTLESNVFEFRLCDLPPDAPAPEEIDRVATERLEQEGEATKAKSIEDLLEKYAISLSISNSELRRSTAKNEYIVDGMLVRNQPAVIGGASKTLKTTIGIDLAISFASGVDFLGCKRTLGTERVLFFTAEIGESTARETESRISKAKGVYEQLDSDAIHWQTWVPYILNDEHIAILKHEIDRTKATIVILDPLYQMLDGDSASSYSLNGQQLRTISQACLNSGATPIIIDHAKRSSQNAKEYAPLELEDISGAGKAEFFRQWLLVSRRKQFDADSPHALWLSYGGSAGHAGLLGVTVDDRIDESTGERAYLVEVESGSKTRTSMDDDRATKKQERDERQKAATLSKNCEKVLLAMVGGGNFSKTKLVTLSGISDAKVSEAIAKLIKTNELSQSEERINGRLRDVFYRPSP